MGGEVDAKFNKIKYRISLYGGVAQLGEHLPCKQGVKSSNLSISIARELDEYERKRSVSLVVGMSTPLTNTSVSWY